MTPTRVWYDPDCDQVWVSSIAAPFPARTLVAVVIGDVIAIRRKGQDANLEGPRFDGLAGQDGTPFADAASAKAYLDGVFSQRRALGFTYEQSVPTDLWTIPHTLGFRPNVAVIDTAGDLCLADAAWPDTDTVLVRFGAPTAGTAYLS